VTVTAVASSLALVVAGAAGPGHRLHTLPDWMPGGGVTVGRHVFLKESQQTWYGIGHELVHVRQQAAQPVWFWVSYLLLPGWRLRWEAEAYAVQARARCPIDGERGLAAYLAGPAYLWPASREQAAAAIRKYLQVSEDEGETARSGNKGHRRGAIVGGV
jgi:hypothetical protein